MTDEEEGGWLEQLKFQHELDKDIADQNLRQASAWKRLALAMRAELAKNHYSLASCLEVKEAEATLRELGELPPYVPPEKNIIWLAIPTKSWPLQGSDPYPDAVDSDESFDALRKRIQTREDVRDLMLLDVEKRFGPLPDAETALPGCLCTWMAWDPSCPVHGEKKAPEVPNTEHDWFEYKPGNFICCRKCTIVRRADGKNKPCPGKVKLSLRDSGKDTP